MDELKNLKKLQRLFNLMDDDALTKEQFIEAFEKVIDAIKKKEEDLLAGMTAFKTAADTFMQNMEERSGEVTAQAREEMQSIASELSKLVETKVQEVKDGRDGIDANEDAIFERVMASIALPEQKPLVSDAPQEIRDKLELLQGNERLDVSAIRGLDEKLKAIEGKARTTLVPIGGPSAGKIVKSHDLSSSLDGSTKTFSLPAFYRVVSVHTSSFPNILRPTTDYTTDGALMTITFTSEIDAATTLATGQTVIIVYAEA